LKIITILCDAASGHPDGTFSLLRGGIDHIFAPKLPIMVNLCVVARFIGSLGEHGDYNFTVRFLTEDGKDALPRLQGIFQINRPGGSGIISLSTQIRFQNYGRYEFVVAVNNMQQDSVGLEITNQPPQGLPQITHAGTIELDNPAMPPGLPPTPPTPPGPPQTPA